MATVQEALGLAVEYHLQGGLTEARELYGRILAVEPDQPHALHLLGVLDGQEGRPVDAMARIRRAIASAPDIADFHANFGKLAMALGRTDEAATLHRRALTLRPGHPDALAGLVPMLAGGAPTDEAVSVLRQRLRLTPEDGGLCFSLARMLRARGEEAEAAAAYRRLIALDPTHGAACNNLGNLLRASGAMEAAATSFRCAVRLVPSSAMLLVNLGAALADLGRTEAAMAAFRRAIACQPDDGDAYCGLGSASSGPCPSDRLRVLNQGLCAAPDHPGLLYALGVLHAARGEDALAIGFLARGVEVAPWDAACRLALCVGQLHHVYADGAELESRRKAYAHHLATLDGLIGPGAPVEAQRGAFDLVGSHLPFLLAYQGMDNRALQETYVGIMAGLMEARLGSRIPTILGTPRASTHLRAARTRLRVGIVSSYFHDHSVWRAILAGWLTQLDPERFTLLGYHVRGEEDACTALAASRCAVFRRGLGTTERWADAIVADRPDALLFPEVGMEPMTHRLAALRLAPVQAVAWGHPDTTGLPTLDHYLSGDLLEPPDGDAFYSERLHRLPNLGCYVEPTRRPVASVTRGRFGMSDAAPAFLCSQSLFKYLPQHDHVFAAIAAAVPGSRFLFFRHSQPTVTRIFEDRLERAFALQGIDSRERCVFSDPLDHDAYLGTLRVMDVYLDSIGFSGFNTALQAVEAGLPVVTLRGNFMRGRLAAALLDRLGMADVVAQSPDDFIADAVRLGLDPAARAIRGSRQTAALPVVYRDRATITGLERFLTG
ncbi:tetratricopeptide repeat protein [Azospirillum formosense]|uniref:protein O-GlcNAc transferase n=1 Tax=Azospirillum formosense TaxID=861533 RepID=A0ABX2L1R4_9PROT|nr:tetratricopeptide repeat protein [Azospirillum formosense]MBY3753468.1 tetratricopeptide repeat protein [Azospirillum formosense]NUB20450.1 tetratricopeptide repeat protein [Azospirillum formosense]